MYSVGNKSYQRKTKSAIELLGYTKGKLIKKKKIRELSNSNKVYLNGREVDVVMSYQDLYLLKGWNEYTSYVVADGVNFLMEDWASGCYYDNLEDAKKKFKEKLDLRRR